MNVDWKVTPDYLHITVTGAYDFDAAVERFAAVIAACRQTGIPKVLVDYRELQGGRSKINEGIYAAQVAELYKNHMEHGGTPLRFAYLANKAVTLEFMPGLALVRDHGIDAYVTYDFDDAVRWLAKGAQ